MDKKIPKIFLQPIPISSFDGKGSLLTSGSEENFLRKVQEHYSNQGKESHAVFELKFLELIKFSGLDMNSKDFWEEFSYFLVINFIKGFSFCEKEKEGRRAKWDAVTQLLLFLDVKKVMAEKNLAASKACMYLKDELPWSKILTTYKSDASDGTLYKVYTDAKRSELVRSFSNFTDLSGHNSLANDIIAELYHSLKNKEI